MHLHSIPLPFFIRPVTVVNCSVWLKPSFSLIFFCLVNTLFFDDTSPVLSKKHQFCGKQKRSFIESHSSSTKNLLTCWNYLPDSRNNHLSILPVSSNNLPVEITFLLFKINVLNRNCFHLFVLSSTLRAEITLLLLEMFSNKLKIIFLVTRIIFALVELTFYLM